MPTPIFPREKVEELVRRYISARGPERAWHKVALSCGYAEGKHLKNMLARYTGQNGIYPDIPYPERFFDRMTSVERAKVEAEASRLQHHEFEVYPPPDAEIDIDSLIAQRKAQFKKKQLHEHVRKLIPIVVKIQGPIGILHFGDPHLDDDSTDLALIERHSELTKMEGLFGASVGDMTNNWVGRLAKLYADQSTTRVQAIMLAEWFIRRTKFLYLVAGNHDMWSGADDPVKWITRQESALYQESEVRAELVFPNGRKVRINCRHDFAGSSIWNPAHGPMRALQHGVRDHIAICGHRHESAYSKLKDPDSGICMHAIKVASYKMYDRYARDKGFRDQHLGPAVLTIINPALPDTHPDMVTVFSDPEYGADMLAFLRKRCT